MALDRRRVLGGLASTLVPSRVMAGQEQGSRPGPVTLTAKPGALRLTGGTDTQVWAYNGEVPGPLLRVTRGQEVVVRLTNGLTQPTTLCWHGVRIANAMDGVGGLTQTAVPPGGSFDYRFVPPDSGLFWYHPHVWPWSAEQIGRGLYGLLIVDEPTPPAVDEDVLVVLDDWLLDAKGQIEPVGPASGRGCGTAPIGSLVTVNSKPVPDRRVVLPGARIRLRLLNSCGARIAIVSLVGATPTVIAVDGQPSEPFQPARGTVPIGPGARFEMIFDLPAGPNPASALVLRNEDAPDQPLLRFETAGKLLAARSAPVGLPANLRLPTRIPLERSLKRDLIIAEAAPSAQGAAPDRPAWCWTLGGHGSDGFSGTPLFTVAQGHAVTLAFVNRTPFAQQMHVHGHAFRVLHDLDDGWDPFWRDSVLVAPGRTKHVAFVADNPGRWAVESLTLARQVGGLAGYFAVEPTAPCGEGRPAAAQRRERRR